MRIRAEARRRISAVRDRLNVRACSAVVGAAIVWNVVALRAQTRGVSYLDDSSMHEQMVRVASFQLSTGHFPLTSWFPYLGLGSPQFLHYQSLPAALTGLVGLAIGPNAAFRWSLYLLVCAWPLIVYACARLFGTPRWGAAAAAAFSPFLMSATGVGYEQRAYLWIGYGVWTQLWASMFLPLSWGFTWRAIREGRGYFVAAATASLTAALHFETGYLALLPIVLWPLVSPHALIVRSRRALLLAAGTLLAAAWAIVPLLLERDWAGTNQALQATPLVNGYGAERVLIWLATGQLLDAGRLPVVTTFAAIGVVIACIRWKADESSRALLFVLGLCLALSFGRTTFGPLANVLPGSTDIFFRRFMMGVQLAMLLLAGRGAASCGRWLGAAIDRRLARRRQARSRAVGTAATIVAALAVLAPALVELSALDRADGAAIHTQVAADRSQGREVDRLIAIAGEGRAGRLYAGMPSNWGRDFTVGAVPVFKYLESRDVDEVGYTLRTASLMTQPEYYFDERNSADYSLFAVGYLILPAGRNPPVPGSLIACAGEYCLWTSPSTGYVHVGTVVGTLAADRSDVGTRSLPVLRSRLASQGRYLRLALGQPVGNRSSSVSSAPPASPGYVTHEAVDLRFGSAAGVLRMRRPGVAVLSASFDSGWRAEIDGHSAGVFAVAPAITAIDVPAGTHRVVFRYVGFSDYAPLFVLAVFAFGALALVDRRRRRGISTRRQGMR